MKKKVLMIIPFENIYPPKNGGLQRCFHVFHQLTKYFDVTAIAHDRKETILAGAENYPSITKAAIYSTYNQEKPCDIFSFLPERIGNALKYRWLTKDISRSADGSFLKFYPLLKKMLKENNFDFIILENLPLTYYTSWIRKYNKKAVIYFNAYNVESVIAQRNGAKTNWQKKEAEELLRVESNLYRTIGGIFCCSQIDLDTFKELNNNKIKLNYVLPNGVDTTQLSYSLNTSEEQMKNIIFCGSLDYEPNKTGLLWFYKNVWPLVIRQLPGRILYVVGRGSTSPYSELLQDKTINFIGEVAEVAPFYRKCNIAIAPLLNGSGTRFKILEAMSLGNPVVTTTIGAEGIDAVPGSDIAIADDATGFADKIIRLSTDRALSASISGHARQLVEDKYSWDKIGLSVASFLETTS